MNEFNGGIMNNKLKKQESLEILDSQEIELPDTSFSRDIENRVIQGIILQALSKIEGISLMEGNLIDNLLGRESSERIKGIYVEQDQKRHSVSIKVEININYGISIPQKSEEIQDKVVEEISNLTGLHVSNVHVVFKNLIPPKLENDSEEDALEKAFVSSKEEE